MQFNASSQNNKKTIVLGVDGVSFEMIDRLSKTGKIPTLERMISHGSFCRLRSTILPITPVAWSTSFTGKNPGKHGVYGFFKKIDGENKKWKLANASDRKSSDLWQIVSSFDRKCIVVGLPFTYPPRPVNGVLVSGHFSDSLSNAVYPEELTNKVISDFQYTVCPHDCRELGKIVESIKNRFRITERLSETIKDWNLLMVGFEQLELAHHNLMVSSKNTIFQLYHEFDKLLSKFLSQYGNENDIFIYSDHGHKVFPKSFHLNNWLISEQYLLLKQNISKIRQNKLLKETEILKSNNSSIKGSILSVLNVGRDIIKRKAPWIKTILPFLKSPKSLRERTISLDFDIYDYINSDAYFYPSANGNYGGIYINKDRDSNEYEELRNEILDNLLNIKDPDNGKAIINRAWKKEELYTGPFLDEIFDIVFEAHSDYYVSTENDDLLNFPNKIVTEREVSQHEIDGILIAQGPSIACSQAESNIMNVMPTILYSMDLPIPNDCDGQVIEKIFTTDYLRNNQLRFTDAIGFDVANSEENEDDAKIIERLKGLGYL